MVQTKIVSLNNYMQVTPGRWWNCKVCDSTYEIYRNCARQHDNCVMSMPPSSHETSQDDSLIVYPSLFPIKVMGLKVAGLVQTVTHIAAQFDPNFDATTVELRESKGGKYLGVTITITATSRAQLDEIYRTLSTHPMVKVVL